MGEALAYMTLMGRTMAITPIMEVVMGPTEVQDVDEAELKSVLGAISEPVGGSYDSAGFHYKWKR